METGRSVEIREVTVGQRHLTFRVLYDITAFIRALFRKLRYDSAIQTWPFASARTGREGRPLTISRTVLCIPNAMSTVKELF